MLSLTSPTKTVFHRIPVGFKMALLAIATVFLFQLQPIWAQATSLLTTVGLYLIPGRRFAAHGLSMLRPLWVFVVVILIWHYWIDDLTAGVRIMLRMLTAVALANLVTMTTRLEDLVDLVKWLLRPLRPFGVNPAVIGLAIAMFVRFTPVLRDKASLLLESWRSRSPRKPGWRVVVPIALVALDDAEHVAEALRARGGVPQDCP